jgi:hypothetical protein
MTWSASAIFRQTVADLLQNTTAIDLDTDVPKVALYDDTPTPDKDVTAANSAYNVDQWASANEQSDAGQWASGGVALGSAAITTPSSGVVMYDANDTASGSSATLAGVYGCQVYDDTLTTPVADQGLCFNYFGGTQSVTGGTFTVVWHANGIFRITV